MMMPIYEASKGRYGWISGQLDPRLFTEVDQMVTDADELRAISPNVMIKVPASMQGIEVLKILTSKGISTNTTTCFTLPQIMASADAAMDGIAIAEKNKVDMSNWRAVITHMIGRLTENPMLDIQAERKNIKLSWADKHWYGIAVFRRAVQDADRGRLCQQAAGLLDARRPDRGRQAAVLGYPEDRGRRYRLHLPAVRTRAVLPAWRMTWTSSLRSRRTMCRDEVMEKMMKIPYAMQAYDPNGLSLEQFNTHPATVATVELFSKGFSSVEGFVAEQLGTRVPA